MNGTTPIHPPASYYWFAAPFLLLGIGLFIHTVLDGIVHVTDSLTQLVVPGSADLNLKKSLSYTVFLEQESVVNGKIYLTPGSGSGLTCSAKSKSTGDTIGMRRAQSTVTYNLDGRSGRSVLSFAVPEDGEYEFGCKYSEGTTGPETVVAVGAGVGTKIVRLVFPALAEMLGGTVLALLVFLSVFFKRERAQKLLRSQGLPAS
jgi:hypothetical protein